MATSTLSRDRPAFRALLGVGDIAPPCVLATADGKTINLQGDDIAGSPLVIAFWPRFDAEPVQTAMASFGAVLPSLASEGARIFAVTLANARAAGAAKSPVPMLLDRDGKVFAAYGVGTRDQPTTIVLRHNGHVYSVPKSEGSAQADAALAAAHALVAERDAGLGIPHPPILVVPDVLSPQDCRRLIQVYETRGKAFVEPGHGEDQMTTDYKMRIPEYGRGPRNEQWIA